LLSDIDLTIDTRSKDVVSVVANNVSVGNSISAVVQDPSLLEIVDHYAALLAVLASRIVGTITATITRGNNGAGESAFGDVITDA